MPTNDDASGLAQAFQPILQFDPTERFFPIAPEEWLDHRATESWSSPRTHDRGSAVLRVKSSATAFGEADVVAGSHYPAGTHLELSDLPPDGIGQPFAFDPATEDLFLDVAGWDDATADATSTRFTEGSIEYLDHLFRRVSNAFKDVKVPPADDDPSPRPQFTVPRLSASTIIAELEWAGRYPRLDRDRVADIGGARDFPPAIGTEEPSSEGVLTDLDNYAVLNYYLLYPAMEPAPSVRNDDSRKREGQWEAISVFLRVTGHVSDRRDADGRPDFPIGIEARDRLGRPPEVFFRNFEVRFFTYSQGYGAWADSDTPLPAETRVLLPEGLVGTSGNEPEPKISFDAEWHPLVWVSAGTHMNFFEIRALTHTDDSPPDPTLSSVGSALMGAGGALMGVSDVYAGAFGVLLFLIGLILWILSFFLKSAPPVEESPDPGGTDLARDGGPVAGIPGIDAPKKPGVKPSGAAIDTVLRVVNRFRFDAAPPVTAYDPPPPTPLGEPLKVESPSWWAFPGRWGVKTVNSAVSTWDSGTRRTDIYERTRGYWNAYQLIQYLSDSGTI